MLGRISGKLITYNPNTGVIHKSGLQQWKSWYFMSTYLSKFTKGEYGNNKELMYWIEDASGKFIEGNTKEYQTYLRLQKERDEYLFRRQFIPFSLPKPVIEDKYKDNIANMYTV